MEINEIFGLLSTIPTWVWVVGGIVIFVILFGDQKLWEFEVKFPMKHGVGRGEVEFECLKKKGSTIEVKFELEEIFHNKPIEIFLNDKLVFTVPQAKNTGRRIYIEENLDLQEPNEGDKVCVHIGGQEQFEGQLYRD